MELLWIGIGILVVVGCWKMMKDVEKANRYAEQKQREAKLKAQADREYLEQIHPHKFEHLIADLFRSQGYEAEVTKASNDGGKDIILRKGKETKLVEVKRYNKSSVGRPLIQKLHSAIVDAEAAGGYFVTLSHFNANARQYAANKHIQLIDGDELIRMMNAQ